MKYDNLLPAANMACVGIYPPINAADFDKVYQVNDTVCGVRLQGGTFFITFQGTVDAAGWMADIDIVSVDHPELGHLHQGFYENLLPIKAMMTIPPDVTVIVTGHSKGAGEAVQFAALLHLDGYQVLPYLFACPNAGEQDFADWIAENMSGLSFRNGTDGNLLMNDPVPLVPEDPYVPPIAHTLIHVPPSGLDRLVPTEWHHAALYLRGVYQWVTDQNA